MVLLKNSDRFGLLMYRRNLKCLDDECLNAETNRRHATQRSSTVIKKPATKIIYHD